MSSFGDHIVSNVNSRRTAELKVVTPMTIQLHLRQFADHVKEKEISIMVQLYHYEKQFLFPWIPDDAKGSSHMA